MPWENSHMHAFYLRLIDGPRWAPQSPFDDDFDVGIKARDSTRTTFAEVLAEPNFKVLRRGRLATHHQDRAAFLGGAPARIPQADRRQGPMPARKLRWPPGDMPKSSKPSRIQRKCGVPNSGDGSAISTRRRSTERQLKPRSGSSRGQSQLG